MRGPGAWALHYLNCAPQGLELVARVQLGLVSEPGLDLESSLQRQLVSFESQHERHELVLKQTSASQKYEKTIRLG